MPPEIYMQRHLLALLIVIAFAFFLIVVPLFTSGISLLVDWMWFDQIGYRELFTTVLATQAGLGFASGIACLLLTGFSVWLAGSVSHRSGYLTVARTIEFPGSQKIPSVFRGTLWVGLILVAWLVAQWSATHWNQYLFATHVVAMKQVDPIFGRNLSFFLFRLPFRFFIYHLALIIVLISL